jgi:hypothetical protein
MPENEIKISSTTKKIINAFSSGATIMLIQSPLVNAFNQWSVVACRYNLSTLQAFRHIFYGNAMQPSILHFRAGMGGHLSKEFPRVLFKSTGLYILVPYLSTQPLSPVTRELIFAGTLSSAEMIINPMDTWQVNVQAGKPLETSFRALYAGSLGNGARQFITWWGFGYSNRKLNELLPKYAQIDPHSPLGIGAKTIPQALFLTSITYGIERVKNEMQYNSRVYTDILGKDKTNKSKYVKAASNILLSQGFLGFTRGFFPKVGGNAILAAGSNILIEKGQQHLKRQPK